jgi:hypothetical protein
VKFYVLMGIGIGWLLLGLLLAVWNPYVPTNRQIELRARELGMVYQSEVLIFSETGR